MDARIDLTENRDFIKHVRGWESLPGWKPYKHSNPISNIQAHFEVMIEKEKEERLDDNWGIFQGNATTRQIKRYETEFCDFITCDCCGKRLFPYYNDGLCLKCRDRLNYEEPDWRK